MLCRDTLERNDEILKRSLLSVLLGGLSVHEVVE